MWYFELFAEFRWHLKAAFGQADGPGVCTLRRQRTDLRNGYIALAQQNGFTLGEVRQIAGKMRFGLVYVDFNHDSLLSHIVD